MTQLGFVLDQSRCIGCHACTVACKSENDVPVGSFRTWVKYTEEGSFPEVKRSFTVLRCNQCTDAPCMTICPTSALFKRADGIVDLERDACIGCKSCMQGCPYDALYINSSTGTAEKCHFCAHRTDIGLAPACAVVCPTEAIVPGDFDDPKSRVSQLAATGRLEARKTEAGTGPNVLYKAASEAGLDPLTTNAAGGLIWSNQQETPFLEAERYRASIEQMPHRTTYDVPRETWWGWRVGAYLWTKSLSAGLLLAAAPAVLAEATPSAVRWIAGTSLLFLLVTTVLLVADLKRPERFLLILRRPNWNSWLVRGTVALMAYGGLLTLWIAVPEATPGLTVVTALAAAASAAYTGFLFAQAKGRVLWMQRGLWLHLIVQAVMAGGAGLLLLSPLLELSAASLGELRDLLAVALVVHVLYELVAGNLAPDARQREFAEAHRLLTRGPYAVRHWGLGLGLGAALPLLLLYLGGAGPVWNIAAVLVLFGLWVIEDTFVRAGQALSIS